MLAFLRTHWKPVTGVGVLLAVILLILISRHAPVTTDTFTVETGTVSETIGISGFIETTNAADLAFPSVGTVSAVLVSEGTSVTTGQLLATLGAKELVAQRAAASASLRAALADRTALQSGPTSESRAVSNATVAAAESALAETKRTEAEKVALAYSALLSNNLTAKSIDPEETATPPTISGTYHCTAEGTYTLTIYRSAADSGYSYQLTGLESGIGTMSTTQPAPIGGCGLYAQFSTDEKYTNSVWTITIPNKDSATYLTYKNAYELAQRQQTQNVTAAEAALTLAQNTETAANAAPRVESLISANAAVSAAEARIAAIDAQLANFSITAPFDGIVTTVDVVTGETANLTPIITVVGTSTDFTLTARIPEIDITKITTTQHVQVRFDAASDTTFAGTITFISPLPTTIDGVAYYEATIELAQTPDWVRAGLNADVDVKVAERTNTLRIPIRFLTHTEAGTFVYRRTNNTTEQVEVTVLFTGNDGYVAIDGLTAGDVLVPPAAN